MSVTTAASVSSTVFLRAQGLRKSFRVGERSLEILHGVDFTMLPGERLGLVGASGAGKSTLLHILGLLDPPSAGRLSFAGRDPWSLSTAERARIRNREIGFVFQFYHLLPELTALENVQLPALIGETPGVFRRRRTEHRERAMGLLERFGMANRAQHRPTQLSGGERQRVAMARALYHDPHLLLADEPTGNLDSATGERVLELLLEEQSRRNLSMILVTHDERLAARCERVLVMEDGVIRTEPSVPRVD